MWDSFEDILNRNPAHRLPETILKPLLAQGFLALDYLHTECKLVHTGKFTFNAVQLLPLTLQTSKERTFLWKLPTMTSLKPS